jgi:hypothetical protein
MRAGKGFLRVVAVGHDGSYRIADKDGIVMHDDEGRS